MQYRLVIFDFDGTLADTFPWFSRVLNGVADRFGFRRVADHEIEALRGRSARQVIAHLDLATWKLPFIAVHMRRMAARDSDQIELFPGVGPVLEALSQHGIVLAIASSNSEKNIRRILGPELAGLISHYACGAGLFGKPSKFRRLAKITGIPAEQTLCIGDEIRDADAARSVGMAFGAVAWGFTTVEALRETKPDQLFEYLDQIVGHLCRTSSRAVSG